MVIEAAFAALTARFDVEAASRIVSTAPLGPSHRRYANAAAVVGTDMVPLDTLAALQAIERAFGRRRRGQRWRARVLDLDLILWSGGPFAGPHLQIPHPAFREREFVLEPASDVAPHWRDLETGLSLRQLHARLTRPRALPR